MQIAQVHWGRNLTIRGAPVRSALEDIKIMEAAWLSAYAVIWVIHFSLFGMQRATLLISRSAGIEWRGGGELLLPGWYPVTWLVIVGQWTLLIAMAVFWNWKFALGFAIGGYVLSVVVPIPYRAYKGIFHRRVKELMRQDPEVATQLQEMLEGAPF